ncbi:MAG: hypothetical protein II612_01500 [Prevotella sp.]|nr:hypothetical protein [Prevotella sp.]
MTKDKELEKLFLAQKPTFDDKADFMATLTKRLDAVEYVRQHQEATLRRYRVAMVVAFVVGIVSGAVTIGLILSKPSDVPVFSFDVQSVWVLWIMRNSRVIVATALALLMTFGTFSVINNVQEILNMRSHFLRNV